jgi:hypothetical protein
LQLTRGLKRTPNGTAYAQPCWPSMIDSAMSKFVYKFLPPERTTYLNDSLLRFTQPMAQNDPFECLPAVPNGEVARLVEGLIGQIESGLSLPKLGLRIPEHLSHEDAKQIALRAFKALLQDNSPVRENFYSKHNKILGDSLGLFCVSRRWNSTLMWSHYAASHEGFCVGFNREHTFFSAAQESRSMSSLMPVQYSARRCVAPTNIRPSVSDIVDIVLTKASDWQYEEEERMVDDITHAARTIAATPHRIALFEVPHAAIAEIIVGARSAPALAAEIRTKAEQLGVPVYQAIVSHEFFDLERVAINS